MAAGLPSFDPDARSDIASAIWTTGNFSIASAREPNEERHDARIVAADRRPTTSIQALGAHHGRHGVGWHGEA
jgi:hypothetical protein